MQITVILPSLNPNEGLAELVRELTALGFCRFIVVNDGSDQAHKAPFEQLEAIHGCTVLHHSENRGKGAALKTAFAYFLANDNENIGVITADGDGQHKAEDILACAHALTASPESLILGVRSFKGADIPPRSRYGNRFTSFVFKAACGISVSDTQTGLRGIGRENIPSLLALSGERFEYETNMLLETKRINITIKEVPIQTVYEGDNKGSHFNPLKDSLRIYRLIFGFMLSSLAGFIVDISLFALLSFILRELPLEWRTFWCTITARLGSSIVNYILNRNAVFSSKSKKAASFIKYYSLCIVQMLVSWIGVWLLSSLLGGFEVGAKLAVDIALFFISFQLQRDWVFK